MNSAITTTIVGAPRWLTAREHYAHAVKNRLTTIRALARLVASEASAAAHERARRLDAAVDALATLVDDELTASKHDDDASETFLPVDVPNLFDAVFTRLTDLAAAARIRLVFDCMPGTVHGIASDLAEAVHNLVSNALDATPAGGAIAVHASVTADGEHLWEIQDSGRGIPSEVLARVGTQRCTKRREGTGLGLAIAAATIGAHGGLLEVSAAASGGTRMTIRLPAGTP